MTEQEIRTILSRQREYFATGATLSRKFRAEQLGKLKASLQRHALQQDLGKSRMESYMCEIGLTLSELTWMQKHLRGLMREKRVPTPLSQFAARSFRSPSPYGTVLIMSPWNYPLLLTLEPLVDAIAAGNTAVLKPSAYAPNAADVIKKIVDSCFAPEYVAVVTGGRAENHGCCDRCSCIGYGKRRRGRRVGYRAAGGIYAERRGNDTGAVHGTERLYGYANHRKGSGSRGHCRIYRLYARISGTSGC